MVVHAFHPSTQEIEASESLKFEANQTGLQSEFQSKKKTKKKQKSLRCFQCLGDYMRQDCELEINVGSDPI